MELKTCPFCGGAAEFTFSTGSWGYYPPSVGIKCSKCWVRTPKYATEDWSPERGTYSIEDAVKKRLIEIWNKRASKDEKEKNRAL